LSTRANQFEKYPSCANVKVDERQRTTVTTNRGTLLIGPPINGGKKD
jgi:hypothetical protein